MGPLHGRSHAVTVWKEGDNQEMVADEWVHWGMHILGRGNLTVCVGNDQELEFTGASLLVGDGEWVSEVKKDR